MNSSRLAAQAAGRSKVQWNSLACCSKRQSGWCSPALIWPRYIKAPNLSSKWKKEVRWKSASGEGSGISSPNCCHSRTRKSNLNTSCSTCCRRLIGSYISFRVVVTSLQYPTMTNITLLHLLQYPSRTLPQYRRYMNDYMCNDPSEPANPMPTSIHDDTTLSTSQHPNNCLVHVIRYNTYRCYKLHPIHQRVRHHATFVLHQHNGAQAADSRSEGSDVAFANTNRRADALMSPATMP